MSVSMTVSSLESSVGSKVTRDSLLASLKGTNVILPNLQSMMKHYPTGVHPEAETLHEDVQKSLDDLFSSRENARRLRKMKASNHALLGAHWWPNAPYEHLRIATYFLTWLFYWDDEIDSQEFSSMIHNISSSSKFRQETLRYIEASLSGGDHADLSHISTNPLITGFGPIGKAISNNTNERQQKAFLQGLRKYVKMTMEEQMSQIEGRLLCPSDYLGRRMYTGAVLPTLAIHEYVLGIELPDDVMQSDALRTICHETNMNICVTNDILSIKKEVEQGQIDSLIPLLVPETGSVQSAVDRASHILRASIQRFDLAEKIILGQYSKNPKLQSDLRLYINGCKYACTANLNWSLASSRYKLGRKSMEGGVSITL